MRATLVLLEAVRKHAPEARVVHAGTRSEYGLIQTTPVDETHPLSVGVVGNYMGVRGVARGARDLLAEADVVLLVGTRTNENGNEASR